MPGWAQFILGAAAVVLALGTLWTKVFKPGIKVASSADEMLPLLRELTKVFRDNPDAFAVLSDIAEQFRTPDGKSTLHDVVARLDSAAVANAQAADLLKVGVEASRQLAERDRQEVQRLVLLIDRLTIKVEGGFTEVKETAGGVADDLAAAHRRADEIGLEGSAGEAADAASRQTTAEQGRPVDPAGS